VSPAARAQISAIQALASTPGNSGLLSRTLRDALRDFNSSPIGFGDPIHSTKLAGGTVYQAFRTPLVFRYAVYRERRVAFLYEVLVS
jgi:hypothetical protein